MILHDYTTAAISYGSALRSGDSRLANRCVSKIEKLFRTLKGDEKWADELHALLKHPQEEVRLWAAAHLINYREEDAKAALLEVIAKKSVVGLVAELTLDRWKSGDLKY